MVKSSAARLDAVFHALADPTRRAILRDVSGGEKNVSDVARPFALTLAAVSKHLNVLEAAELIARERRGSFQIVRLKPTALEEAEHWLSYYRQFWSIRLDALAQHLEENPNERASDSSSQQDSPRSAKPRLRRVDPAR